MYFAAELKQMLPAIVWPVEVALGLFQQDLERMLMMRGKVGSLPELSMYIETLQVFYEGVEALKYRIFEQSNRDTDQTVASAEISVRNEMVSRQFADEAIRETGQVEAAVVAEVTKALDHKIKRAKTMLDAAKALERDFVPR